MSIINRMLKDLETSHTPDSVNRFYSGRHHRLPAWYWFVLVLAPVALWLWWPSLQALRHPVPVSPVARVPIQQPKAVLAATATVPAATAQSSSSVPATSTVIQSVPVGVKGNAAVAVNGQTQIVATGSTSATTSPATVQAASTSVPVSTSSVTNKSSAETEAVEPSTSTGGAAPVPASVTVQNGPGYVKTTRVLAPEAEHGKPEAESRSASSTVANEEASQPSASTEIPASEPSVSAEDDADDTGNAGSGSVVMVENKPEMHVQEEHLSQEQLATIARRDYQSAIAKEDSSAAENALQNVLAHDPLDMSSRKKLAALYYGQQRLEEGLRVMEQGIHLTPMSPDLRLYAARIALAMNNRGLALNYLTAISPSAAPNIDFYAMRAGLAQQLGQHLEAINSYRSLMVAQPDVGRWALGLAISEDKNMQSQQAKLHYRRALLDAQLPLAARQFAQQRLHILEQKP